MIFFFIFISYVLIFYYIILNKQILYSINVFIFIDKFYNKILQKKIHKKKTKKKPKKNYFGSSRKNLISVKYPLRLSRYILQIICLDHPDNPLEYPDDTVFVLSDIFTKQIPTDSDNG